MAASELLIDDALRLHIVSLYLQACAEGREPDVWVNGVTKRRPVGQAPTLILKRHLDFVCKRMDAQSPAAQFSAQRRARSATSWHDIDDNFLRYAVIIEAELTRRNHAQP